MNVARTSMLAAIGLAIALAPLPARASETPAAATEIQKFGAPVTVKKAVPVAKLEKNAARYAGKTVKVEGVVAEVCQNRGCWVEIGGVKGAGFIAKSLDESVLVPKDSKGKKVMIQGVVTALPAKGHESCDHAEGEGHACPTPKYVVSMLGVELHPAR